MTLKELMEYSDELVPNPFSFRIKTAMVNQIEAEIMHDVFLLSLEDVVQYDWETDQDAVLFLKPPHTDVYKNYMKAMLYREMGEAARYNNENDLFNESLRTLCRCVAEKIHPSNGRAMTSGYYISAYAIAVKHGYEGSEEEWIKSIGSGGVAVDETLLRKGMAADAEVVGDKLRALQDGSGRVNVDQAEMKTASIGGDIYAQSGNTGATDDGPVLELYGMKDDGPVKLRNVAEPTFRTDAVNKAHFDAHSSKVYIQKEEPMDAKDGDLWIDTDELEEDEPEIDEDAFVTVEEMKKHVAEAISSALGKIGYAEEVEY